MQTTPDSVLPRLPVSQESDLSEMDVWDPPFERWIRLADSLLGALPNLPRQRPKPQTLAALPRN